MSTQICVARFWKACDLDPAQGIRTPMLSSGTRSVRAFISSRVPPFEPTIRGCFRPEDQDHMFNGTPDYGGGFDLYNYVFVRENAQKILDRVSTEDNSRRMPPPPDDWGQSQIDLFARWRWGGMPP